MRLARFALCAALAAPALGAAERDLVSWELLAQVHMVRESDRYYVPVYADAVRKLDATEVKLQGFMIPLVAGRTQGHFLLAANPSDCGFCMPGGPESYVEVQAKTPLPYTTDPLVLKGRLSVLRKDPSGMFYRLVEAVVAK